MIAHSLGLLATAKGQEAPAQTALLLAFVAGKPFSWAWFLVMAGLHHLGSCLSCARPLLGDAASMQLQLVVQQMRSSVSYTSSCVLQLRLIVPGQWKAAWTCEVDPAEEVTSLAATVLRNIHTGEQAVIQPCSWKFGALQSAASCSQKMQQKWDPSPWRVLQLCTISSWHQLSSTVSLGWCYRFAASGATDLLLLLHYIKNPCLQSWLQLRYLVLTCSQSSLLGPVV